jgi:hypothetical protein
MGSHCVIPVIAADRMRGLRSYCAAMVCRAVTPTPEPPMLRFLAAGWLTRRLAAPLSRAIPNPYLRAIAMTGAGALVTRMLTKRNPERPRQRRRFP